MTTRNQTELKSSADTASDKFESEHLDHSQAQQLNVGEVAKNAPAGYEPTDEEKGLDKGINRKLDLIILPICAINFLLCGIDKGNLGNAATSTFVQDAGLRPDDIGDAVSILSVTFVTLQPFGVALGRRVGVTYWIPLIMTLWGACTMAHAGVHNRATLFALRLLLGAFEASFFPSTVYYTIHSFFSFRFAGMYSIASAFSGALAYGLLQLNARGLHGWKWLFIRAFTILFAGVTFLVLPRSNRKLYFLNAEQQAHHIDRQERDIAAHNADLETSGNKMNWRDVRDALAWHKLAIIVGNIQATLPVSAFGVFAPLLVKGMGYSSIDANLMTIPPFAVGAVLLWCFLYSSDRYRERSLHTCAAMVLAIVGLAVMYASNDNKTRYGFLFVCLGGAFLAWLAGNTPVTSTRALVIGINGYSNLAGVIAGQIFKASKYGPTYKFSLKITMILMAIGMCIFVAIRVYYQLLNKKRRAKIATMSPEEIEAERLSLDRRGDAKVTFLYGEPDPSYCSSIFARLTNLTSGNYEQLFDLIQDSLGKMSDKEKQEQMKKVNGVFEMRVKNAKGKEGVWTIDLKKKGEVYGGNAKPKADVTISLSDDTFQKLADNKINGQKAFMSGQLKVKGNIMLATKLDTVLKGAQAKL
ncbi:hypothetical protein JCM11251_003795 [Rhodosporidiobolus azoricus]